MFRFHSQWFKSQVSIGALFFFLGFQYATWGARLPVIKEHLGLDAAQVGMLLLASGLGAALSFPLVAMMMNRLGSLRVIYLSAIVLGLFLPVLAWVPNYPTAIFAMFCDGVACALMNAAMNAQGAALEMKSRQNMMSKLHATFSFGALFAAIFSSGVMYFTANLSTHFIGALVVLFSLLISTRRGLLSEDMKASKEERIRFRLPSWSTLCIGFALFFGTITEGSMNDWSALYLVGNARASAKIAPMGIAVVSIMMVLARLFADGWRKRWGDKRVVMWGGVLASFGLAIALLMGGVVPALTGLACVGLGMAAVTPCIYVEAAKKGPDTLTLVAAMGETGLLAGPPVIGLIANASSLVWGMGFVALSAGLVSIFATRIHWSSSKENEPKI